MTKYTINLVDEGVNSTCKNVHVEWVRTSGCAAIKSISKDGYTVEVTYPEGCTERLQAVVSCKDECQDCPTEIKNVQPCDSDFDCPDCEECVDSLCTSLCEEGDICSGNRCVECIGNGQCPGNQTCVNGKCVCPPGLKEYKGNCVECTPHDKLSNCQSCINGSIVEDSCGDLYLDPSTCECVSCVNSGHCGDNQVCNNGECECIAGYRKNNKGVCVKNDECVYDNDCAECETCNTGKCKPKVCPNGYECVGDECLEICDPLSPRCGTGNCINLGNNYYCFECSGTCDENIDCGVGCYCDGNICVRNPGYKLCTDGEDCPDGYGCDPTTNSCVPCSSMTCEHCSNGCYCDNGEDCLEYVDDSGDGDNEEDACDNCPEGFGCLGGECVECSSVSCSGNMDCPVGCECYDNNCRGVEHNDDDCINGLSLEKTDCGLEGTTYTTRCCECDTIGIGYEIIKDNGTSYDIEVSLRKGAYSGVESLFNKPSLNNTGIYNDTPIGGSIELYAKVYRAKYYKPGDLGNKILTPEVHKENSVIEYLSGHGVVQSTVNNSYPIGVEGFHSIDSGGHKVYIKTIKVEIFAKLRNSINFENECKYSSQEEKIYTLNIGDVEGKRSFQDTRKETPCRKPLLKFYKSESLNNIFKDEPFFQVYDYNFELTDFLDHGIEPLKYYGLRSDCGCTEDVILDCGKLIFCTPKTMEYKFNNCGTELEFTSPVEIGCQIYMDSGRYPMYELVLNNEVVGRTTPTNKTIFYQGTKFSLSSGKVINSLTLRIVGNECHDCNLYEEHAFVEVSGGLDMSENVCSSQSNMVLKYTVQGGEKPYTVTIEDPTNATYTYNNAEEGTYTKEESQPGTITGNYKFKVVDNAGCEFEETVYYEEVSVGDNYEVGPVCSPELGILFKNNDSVDALFHIDGHTSPVIVKPGKDKFYPLSKGTYSIEATPVVDGSNIIPCKFTDSVSVDCCKGVSENEVYFNIVSSDLQISVINNNSGKVTYEVIEDPSSSKGTKTLTQGAYHKFTGLDEDKKHIVKAVSDDGLSCPEVVIFTYDPSNKCDDIDNNVTIEAICSGIDKYVRVLNPTGINLKVEIENSVVESGSTDFSQLFSMNADPATVKVTDLDSGCDKTVQLSKDCCTNLEPIKILDEECYKSGSDTYKRISFNHVSNVKDNNNNNVLVVNNEVDFKISGLTSITATYNHGGCTDTKFIDDLDNCPCLTVESDISVTTVPGVGSMDGQFTVNNGDKHSIKVYFGQSLVYSGSSSYTQDIGFGDYSVEIHSEGCTFTKSFTLSQECECEDTGGWYALQNTSGFYTDVNNKVGTASPPSVKIKGSGGTKVPPGGMSTGDGSVAGYRDFLFDWLRTIYGSTNVIVVEDGTNLNVFIKTCEEELTSLDFGSTSYNFECGNIPV